MITEMSCVSWSGGQTQQSIQLICLPSLNPQQHYTDIRLIAPEELRHLIYPVTVFRVRAALKKQVHVIRHQAVRVDSDVELRAVVFQTVE